MKISVDPAVIVHLVDACNSLMGEVAKKRATDWGIVNGALVEAATTLKTKPIGPCTVCGKPPKRPICERHLPQTVTVNRA